MSGVVDVVQYEKIEYVAYTSLRDKLEALLRGEVLLVKNFERKSNLDVLIRVVDKRFTVSQMTYDIVEDPSNARYWVTFNVGINDLSLFSVFKFDDKSFSYKNKFKVDDRVDYVSKTGQKDAAIVEEVYVSKTDPEVFVYKLSREEELYEEKEIVAVKFM
ncbi:UNVERIFIED_ORG: hypothetical protein Xoosp15_1 [Xanthomonas phage Xoo-sp15]